MKQIINNDNNITPSMSHVAFDNRMQKQEAEAINFLIKRGIIFMNIIKCKSTLGKDFLQHRIKLKTDTVDIKAILYKKLNKLKESTPVPDKENKSQLEIKINPIKK